MKKEFEQLNIIDNFLMNEIANDAEVGEAACREIVSSLLQRKIGEVRIIPQKNIPPGLPNQRGIILDVEIEENIDNQEYGLPGINVYDVEPHRKPKNKENLPKRTRFYQAKIDSRRLKSGERDFGKLPNLYIIFILDYDPFGFDRVCYTFDNACVEIPELKYDDGLEIIYFNTTGTVGGNESIRNMLHFIENSTRENAVDDATIKMYDYVRQVKEQEVSKMRFMTYKDYFAEYYADEIEEAKEKAKKEAIEEVKKEVSEEVKKEVRAEGRTRNFIMIICKKIKKVKEIEVIANELEEEPNVIRPLYEIAVSFAPGYDEEKIYAEYMNVGVC